MDLNAVSVISAVVAVVAAGVATWQLRLMRKYRREDADAAQQLREQEAATLRSSLRLHFQSLERHIPNVTVPPPSEVRWTAFSNEQMRPVRSIEESLSRLVVLPSDVQRAVRDAYQACMKLGPPYTTTTPPREDVLRARETVAAVLSLL